MIRKAIVLAAGKGLRLRPLTLAIPKEMIRVGIRPVIEHALMVLKAGGIQQALIVVGRQKEAIMDYLGSGERVGIDIYYKIQETPTGTADAVYHGREFVGQEDFAVIYGDNYLRPAEMMKEVAAFHGKKRPDATLVLHPVKDPTRFGIAKMDPSGRVLRVIEKPTAEEAEPFRVNGGYLNIAGLLLLKPAIFNFIKRTSPGKDGELWLTDSIALMIQTGRDVLGFLFRGVRYDIGTFESLMEADRLEQSGE